MSSICAATSIELEDTPAFSMIRCCFCLTSTMEMRETVRGMKSGEQSAGQGIGSEMSAAGPSILKTPADACISTSNMWMNVLTFSGYLQ